MRLRTGRTAQITGATVMCLAMGLAACGDDDPDDLGIPEYDPSTTASTETSAAPTSAESASPVDLQTVGVPADVPEYANAPITVQDITPTDVGGLEQYEVVVARVNYRRTIRAQYVVPEFDEAALRGVATGPILDAYLEDIPAAVAEGRRIVDFTDLWPNTVTINEDRAELYDCQLSADIFVDAAGNPLETPAGEIVQWVQLVRIDGEWLVNDTKRAETCPITTER